MNIKQLNEILAQKDTKKILTNLKNVGYKDMTKDKVLRNFSLESIAKSEVCESTEYHISLKFGFSATFHDKIKDLPNHQVVWLQVDKIDLKRQVAMPIKCYIYYKNN